MAAISETIAALRRERGLTQHQVADRLGVTASVVSAYEGGLRQPSYEVLIKLVRLYGVSADYLLGISGERAPDSRYVVSLDGLTPSRIALVKERVAALKE